MTANGIGLGEVPPVQTFKLGTNYLWHFANTVL